MSYRAYARHRGVSPEAVSKAVKTGRITVDANGRIDPERADKDWAENTNPAKAFSSVINKQKHPRRDELPTTPGADASTPAPGVPSYLQSRAIREAYEARLAKLEFEIKTGRLVNADEVKVMAFNVARITRDRMMNIPDRIAPILAAMSDSHEIHKLLSAAIRLACEELTRTRFYTRTDAAKEKAE